MSKEPNRNVYVGHRYVPLIMGEWDKSIDYEGLSIVTHKGASYTSKKRVPVGIDISNNEFWVITGNYDAQVEYYRRDVEVLSNDVSDLTNDVAESIVYVDQSVEDLTTHVNNELATNKKYVDDSVDDLTTNVNNELATNKKYVDDSVVDLTTNVNNELATNKKYVDDSVDDLTDHVNDELEVNTLDYLSLTKDLEGGTLDNLQAIKDLSIKAKNENKGLYIPHGKYYVSDDISISMIRNIIIDGEIIIPDNKIFEIVYDSRFTDPLKWDINRVEGHLRLSGIKNGISTIGFARHLELFADRNDTTRSSIAYSQFHLGTIDKLSIYSPNNGWINENSFYGGRIQNIYIDGEYKHNNNTFYKPMLELFTVEIMNGSDNIFYDCRFEAENEFYFSEKSFNNIFYRSWSSFAGSYLRGTIMPFNNNITDLGVGNGIFYQHDNHYNETVIYEIDSKSNNFNLDYISKHENHLQSNGLQDEFFDSGLIKINGDVGVLGISDKKIFRFRIYLYDENKNLIAPNSSEDYVSYLNLSVGDERYYSSANMDSLNFAIFKNTPVKYFRIELLFGASTRDEIFNHLKIFIRHEKRKQPENISNNYVLNSSSRPEKGHFKRGEYVNNNRILIYGEGTESARFYKGWLKLTNNDTNEASDWYTDTLYLN